MAFPRPMAAATEEDFVARGSAFIANAIRAAMAKRGHCLLGLCGGTSVGLIYTELGREKGIDWSKVTIFLTDERFVSADDPRSNQFLLRSTLLRTAPIPESQLLFPDTSLPIAKCITAYDHLLKAKLAKAVPDLVVLGMGKDGHIASLFPPLEDHTFGPGSAIHTTTAQFEVRDRISVTLPVLQHAHAALILLKGKEKHVVWEQMMGAAEDRKRWPLQAVFEACETTVVARW